jgi:hypothetical protein
VTLHPRPWRLAPHVHLAVIDADMVFLDVLMDRYHCLPDGALAMVVQADGRGLEPRDETMATTLARAGLIVETDDGSTVQAPHRPRPVRESLVGDRPPAPSWRDLPSLAAGFADSVIGYRPKSFAALVDEARRHCGLAVDDAPPSGALQDVVRTFHRWNVYAPISGKCLLQCYVLQRALWRRGMAARWIFGVATWPFRAHCWLQAGDVALTDPVDRLIPYSPILAV